MPREDVIANAVKRSQYLVPSKGITSLQAPREDDPYMHKQIASFLAKKMDKTFHDGKEVKKA